MPHRQHTTNGLSIIIIILGIIFAFNWGGSFNLALFFGALALASFIKPLGSSNAREIYNGLMGACWLAVLALFFWSGSWVWFIAGGVLSWFLDKRYKPEPQRNQQSTQTQGHQYETPVYTPPLSSSEADSRDYSSYEQGYTPQGREQRNGEDQTHPYTTYATPSQTTSSFYPSSELPEAQYPQQLPPQSS